MTDLELYTEMRKDDDLKHLSDEDLMTAARLYNKIKKNIQNKKLWQF